ncbi:transient receptor potential cation channel subfamily A member 1-like [Physella acuta]|uniref:transient receptor potential cation channel subfamily A member 1-like n=1 Tax=Physella acuta TaxID=109671 RepID=UPI0027DB33B7|nr:transient receptor potential cation channel subfamily A member 1-like [Physella acuta]
MIKVMHQIAQLDVKKVRRDNKGRTPLHCAAVYNRFEIMEYFVSQSQKVDIDVVDKAGQTPLVLAASQGSLECVRILLKRGANPAITGPDHRNFLHHLILQNINLKYLLDVIKNIPNLNLIVNAKDTGGYTPLHHAAELGLTSAVPILFELGAQLRYKNKENLSPFHLAIKAGCMKVCLAMLKRTTGGVTISEIDGRGRSPVHLAARYGHVKILDTLVKLGARMKRDKDGNTPLHYAAAAGNLICAENLLHVWGSVLNAQNNVGDTALHLAARNNNAKIVAMLLSNDALVVSNDGQYTFLDDAITNRCVDVAEGIVRHERWTELLNIRSAVCGHYSLEFIKHIPSAFKIVLDKCIQRSDLNQLDSLYTVTYNFTYLHLDQSYQKFAETKHYASNILLPLKLMIKYKREALLSHPLTLWYLRLKWMKYGILLTVLRMSLYATFLSCLTSIVVSLRPLDHYDGRVLRPVPINYQQNVQKVLEGKLPSYDGNEDNESSYIYLRRADIVHDEYNEKTRIPTPYHIQWLIGVVAFYIVISIIKDGIYFWRTEKKFLSPTTKVTEWIMYCSTTYFIVPMMFNYRNHYQWSAGAIAIYLAWFNCYMHIQRFDYFGIYVVMYIETMKTLLKVLLLFFMLVMAFGLAFYVALSDEPTQSNKFPFQSIYRTFIMIFNLDFLISFGTEDFNFISFFLLALYLLLLPTLLVNLMIGVAVGDIASVLANAREKKLATQVKFFANIENTFPFLTGLIADTYTVYPNADNYDNGYLGRLLKLYAMSESKTNEKYTTDISMISKTVQMLSVKIRQQNQMLLQIATKMKIQLEGHDVQTEATVKKMIVGILSEAKID